MTSVAETADQMSASLEAALAGWRSAFDALPSSSQEGCGRNEGVDGGLRPWEDRVAYRRRLGTYRAETYFAKPLALSPLVCAAFGWENTAKDVVQCLHPGCGATLCVAFHPGLDETSRDELCRKYVGMLTSSHAPRCPFDTFARRWSRSVRRCGSRGGDSNKVGGRGISKHGKDSFNSKRSIPLEDKVADGLGGSRTDFYVPPYLLPLLDEYLHFEDSTNDGSITRIHIREIALLICDELQKRLGGDSDVGIMVPDTMKKFWQETLPGGELDEILWKEESMRVPTLLSIFGWSVDDDLIEDKAGVVVRCGLCQVRTRLPSSSAMEVGTRKRRRVDAQGEASLNLIDSHRIYCPYVAGFSDEDLPGWKVVVSNLLKSASDTPIE